VLFSSRAPIGLVAINSIPVATNQGFKSFIPDPARLDAGYLYYWLKANRPSLERLGVGATFKEVSKAIVSRIQIPLPPLAEQRRIAAILDQAEELRAKRRAAIALLDQLPQAIFLDMFGDPATNPMGWPRAPLSELADARLGKMLDQKKQSSDAPLPYVGNANVQWFRLELGQLQTMTFLPREKEVLALRNGDVLICEGGEPGRAAIWRDELAECYFQKAIHRVRVDRARLTPMFLVHYLYRVAKSGGLKDYVTSATIAHLTGEKLRTLPVVMPPLDLQREFVKRLNTHDGAIAAHKRALDQLDTLFAALCASAFGGHR
jgi:type I restriction enzyme S subunit